MKTSCEHCIFAIRNNGVQEGCMFSRLGKFQELNKAEFDGKSYSVSDYCNLCRNVYWDEYREMHEQAEYHGDDDMIDFDKLATLAEQEAQITYDAFIDLDGAKIRRLKKTIDNLNKEKYKPRKIVLFGKLNDENLEWGNKFKDIPNLVTNLSMSDDKFTQTAPFIHRSVANYLLFVSNAIDYQIDVEKFDKAMNVDLKPIIYHNSNNCFFVSTFFYKSHIQYDNPFTVIINGYDEYGKPKS